MLHPLWRKVLENDFSQKYYRDLMDFLESERQNYDIYPPVNMYFRALSFCAPADIRVVILGQDPYHGPDQADGLAFSVQDNVPIPPSLRNIFTELQSDMNIPYPINGNLTRWATQKVLLLNNVLSVRGGQAGSHHKQGWEIVTDTIIRHLNNDHDQIVFMLWGKFAQVKARNIDPNKHYVLTSPHPSPLSAYRGFLGNKHFSKANDYLRHIGKQEITW